MNSHNLHNLYDSLTSSSSVPDIQLLVEHPAKYIEGDLARIGEISRRYSGDGSKQGVLEQEHLFPRLHAFAVACLQSHAQTAMHGTRQGAVQKVEDRLYILGQSSSVEKLACFAEAQWILTSAVRDVTRMELSTLNEWEKRILDIDYRSVAALVLHHLEDEKSRGTFLAQKDSSVDQGLLDLLQLLLGQRSLAVIHDKLLRSQLKLAKHTGLYPSSLRHRHLENITAAPVAIGGFGDIYKAQLRAQDVAVKAIRGAITDGLSQLCLTKTFAQEVVLWSHVSHSNILPFYGVYVAPYQADAFPRISLLSPWMVNGNAVEYVKANPHIDRESLVLDIVHGLDYLHSFNPSIVHGDLKGDNILVSPSGRACIADFGLGRLAQDKSWLTSAGSTIVGAYLYLAPELLDDQPADLGCPTRRSLPTDVYAFGCVCYELYSGKARFSDLSTSRWIQAILGNQPCPKPARIRDALWDKVQRCWELEPTKRPIITDFYVPLKARAVDAYCGAGTCEWDGNIPSQIVPEPPQAPSAIGFAELTMQVGETPPSAFGEVEPSPLAEGNQRRVRGVKLQGWKTAGLASTDVILLILGAPLSGKSSFVKKYFADPALPVGPIHHQLLPPSHEVAAYLASGLDVPDLAHSFVLMIDTPGLFSWRSDDVAIIKEVIDILQQNRGRQIRFLYVHDIGSPRMTMDITMSLAILRAMCGQQAYQNIWLVTSGWGPHSASSLSGYEEREAHLKSVYWRELLGGGAQYRRVHGTSTEQTVVDEIVRSVALDSEISLGLRVQQELSRDRGNVHKTEVWRVLRNCLGMLLEEEVKSGGEKERREFLKRKYREMTRK